MTDRLPTELEATGIIRRAQAEGDFATIMRKGDSERGALMLVVTTRGRHVTCLERVLDLDGGYRWNKVGPAEGAESQTVSEFLLKRARFDEDLWAIELDVAYPERFIAETTIVP